MHTTISTATLIIFLKALTKLLFWYNKEENNTQSGNGRFPTFTQWLQRRNAHSDVTLMQSS